VLAVVGGRPDLVETGEFTFERVELRVNDFTGSRQANVALDMDEAGRIVATWDSRRQQSGTSGIFARWIDPSGTLRGREEQVNLEVRSIQSRPSVALSATGEPWFAWTSYGQDGSLGAIVGRGRGDESVVNDMTAGDQIEVSAVRLADGGSVAAWSTPGSDPEARRVVYRLFDAQGHPLTDERSVAVAPGRIDRLPTSTAAGKGFVTAWARSLPSGDIEGIFARRFDREGNPLGPAFRVSESAADAVEPSVAADSEGRFVVAWMRLDPETDYDVMMRLYDAEGTPVGPERPASADRAGWQSGAAVAMAPGGRFAIAWNSLPAHGRDSDIYARIFAPDGTPVTGDFRVNGQTRGVQMLTAGSGARRLAMGADGRLAVGWQGDSGRGDETAANVTLLIPKAEGILHDLAAGTRAGRNRLAALFEREAPHLDATAAPHVPPTFDPDLVEIPTETEPVVQDGPDIGFVGFVSTGWTPPDPHMAAGPNHVMLIVNGGIAAKQKDGTLDWQDEIEGPGGFWGAQGAGGFVFDPEVLYDPLENRFLAMANERTSGRSYFLLAISRTSDPNGPWHKYRFDVTSLAGDNIDSPNMAVDDTAIYLTADFFGPDKYLIFIIDKFSVLNGGTAVTTSYLHTGTQSFGIPSMYTTDAPRMYMVEGYEGAVETKIRLWAINDPLGTPNLQSIELDVGAYGPPVWTRSRGTSTQVITFEARFWSCMYRNGSLWACHHISDMNGSGPGCVARWYEIEMNGWPVSGTPSIVQEGTVNPGSDIYLSFNSIGVDDGGNAMMVFARSSTTEYYSISRTWRWPTDPPGTMRGPDFVKESTTAYHSERWGDYSAVVPDPVEHDRLSLGAVGRLQRGGARSGAAERLLDAPRVRRVRELAELGAE
jgi:hypothetical protein